MSLACSFSAQGGGLHSARDDLSATSRMGRIWLAVLSGWSCGNVGATYSPSPPPHCWPGTGDSLRGSGLSTSTARAVSTAPTVRQLIPRPAEVTPVAFISSASPNAPRPKRTVHQSRSLTMTLRCRMGSLRFLLAMIEHATRRVPTALSSGPLPGPIVAPDQPADRGQSAAW